MEKKTKEDYTSSYEYMHDNIWREMRDSSDERYYPTFSFFRKRKQGESFDLSRTRDSKGVACLKVQELPVKVYEYNKEVGITFCMNAIKERFVTKSGQTRKAIENLPVYTQRDWENLLHYLREEWESGNRSNVDLTGKEWWLLFGNDKKK